MMGNCSLEKVHVIERFHYFSYVTCRSIQQCHLIVIQVDLNDLLNTAPAQYDGYPQTYILQAVFTI